MFTKSLFTLCYLLLIGSVSSVHAQIQDRPNIVWISTEDISPHFGCYGDPHAITPNIDQFATEGVRYSQAFTTAGVCAPCRSGIITGMYQSSLGTQHMRCTATLPDFIQPFPIYLRKAGYYCTNASKTDYQFKHSKETWDESSGKAHWRNRKDKDQPFFAVFNYTGTHEGPVASIERYKSITKDLKPSERQDPTKLELPPYYPDTPIVRAAWKRNYELITTLDTWASDLIQQLKDDGLYEDTIVFIWSDHGVGLPRAKRWLYDSGTHIPLIVRIPEKWRINGQGKPGTVSDQLVSSIDFGPTVLNLAGVKLPGHVQGVPFLGKKSATRDYVYGARDRMDERYDIIRMVRDKQYKYIRNFLPNKTYYQYMNTPEKGQVMQEIRRLAESNTLPPAAQTLMSPTKPTEELYDTQVDPHEINNLADNPKYQNILTRMRAAQLSWVHETKDLGLIPEPILADRSIKLGSEYAILRQPGGDAYNKNIAAIASAASNGDIAELPNLIKAMSDSDDVIRYWGATGIGNIGLPTKELAQKAIRKALTDESSAVRTAAARALCSMNLPEKALPVLIHELTTGTQWERLHAAIALDEIDEQARPVIEQMKVGMEYQEGFNSKGKYRVRVTNRALNDLNGTNNTVP